MKRFIFLLLIYFTSIALQNTFAQEWAPIGAKWHFTRYFNNQAGVSFSTIESVKDTTILGKSCRKIEGHISDCSWNTTYTYISNDSVYFYHPDLNKFCLLYDFGATTNDTWEVLNITGGAPDTIVIHVDSTSQIEVSGQQLKVLYTSMINSNDFPNSGFGGEIIENIGASGFTPTYNYCSPPEGILRCYTDDLLSYQTGPYACEEVTVGIKENEKIEIRAYPNPVRESLFIDMDFSVNEYGIKIYDLSNKIVFEDNINSNSIDMSFLKKGIYSLFITSQDGEPSTIIKFIKL